MKKIIALLLSLSLLFSFGACGKSKEIEAYTAGVDLIKEMIETEPMSEWQVRCVLEVEGYEQESIDIIIKALHINWKDQALRVCENQINEGPISKSGLINFLTILQFTDEEIKYGLDNLDVSWEEQCLFAAMNFISQGFTDKKEIKKLLIADGFTNNEIKYALNVIGTI